MTPMARSGLPDDSTADGDGVPETFTGDLPSNPLGSAPVTTGRASCARCRGRLGPGTFACRSCHRVLCGAHQAVDDVCEDCYLAGLDRRLPPRPGGRSGKTPPPGPVVAASPSPPTIGPTRMLDRGRIERSLADTPPPPTTNRPPDFRTLELSENEVAPAPRDSSSPPSAFDPAQHPTLAEIEALDMMPLLDTEGDEDSSGGAGVVDPGVHSAETKRDFPIPVLEPMDELTPRPQPRPSDALTGVSFVCPHCDTPLAPSARACPRCRRAL